MLGGPGEVGVHRQPHVQQQQLQQGERPLDIAPQVAPAVGGELPEGVLEVLIVDAEEPRGLQADIGMDLPDPLPVDDIVRVQPGPKQALEVPFLRLLQVGHQGGIGQERGRDRMGGQMREELLDVAIEEGVE